MIQTEKIKLVTLCIILFLNIFYYETQGKTVTLKITTLNTEWLSCPNYGPENDALQINNITEIIRTLQPDIIALQEVGTSNDYATLDTIVKNLGEEWGGNIFSNYSDNCGQNLGFIYKKSKIQVVGTSILNSGISSQGNSYYYNWSSGRYPVLYNVNLIDGNNTIPVSMINLHAKAMSDETSYIRRKGASEGLKAILDGNDFNTKKIILLGDFNDYLEGSQCSTCGDSPYKNFVDDSINYRGLTTGLTNPYYNNPLIDQIVISNELFDNYVPNSCVLETAATYTIPNYRTTTSDHTPVTAVLNFQTADPDTDDCVNITYSETFSAGLGSFIPYSVSGTQGWYWKAVYGACVSGYSSGINNENEDWLISPAFNLSGMESATLSFEHALNYSPSEIDKITNHTLWVSSNYQQDNPNSATWTQLNIPVMASGNSWVYTNSGNINLPAQMMTNNVRFAFKYLSTTSIAGTWEIRNLRFNTTCAVSANPSTPIPKSNVYGFEGHIKIWTVKSSKVNIYDLMGKNIFTGIVTGNIEIAAPKSGIYLVRIDNETYKVLVKQE